MWANWKYFWQPWSQAGTPLVINSAIFNRVRGVTWNIDREDMWSTLKTQTQNGRWIRIPNWSQPLWRFVYRWGYVKDRPNDLVAGNAYTDLRTLWGDILSFKGQAVDFFYQPDDSAVINRVLLPADANGNVEITHDIGGYSESVQALDLNSLLVTFNGILQPTPSIAGPNTVAPYLGYVIQSVPAQTAVQVSFNYFYRCMLDGDTRTYENFMFQLWILKELPFVQVRV